jgi:hypothetical protein
MEGENYTKMKPLTTSCNEEVKQIPTIPEETSAFCIASCCAFSCVNHLQHHIAYKSPEHLPARMWAAS